MGRWSRAPGAVSSWESNSDRNGLGLGSILAVCWLFLAPFDEFDHGHSPLLGVGQAIELPLHGVGETGLIVFVDVDRLFFAQREQLQENPFVGNLVVDLFRIQVVEDVIVKDFFRLFSFLYPQKATLAVVFQLFDALGNVFHFCGSYRFFDGAEITDGDGDFTRFFDDVS